MTNDTINMRIKILNEKGLHARAAAKFVELVDTFDVSLLVKKDNLEASGDSIMGYWCWLPLKGQKSSWLHQD